MKNVILFLYLIASFPYKNISNSDVNTLVQDSLNNFSSRETNKKQKKLFYHQNFFPMINKENNKNFTNNNYNTNKNIYFTPKKNQISPISKKNIPDFFTNDNYLKNFKLSNEWIKNKPMVTEDFLISNENLKITINSRSKDLNNFLLDIFDPIKNFQEVNNVNFLDNYFNNESELNCLQSISNRKYISDSFEKFNHLESTAKKKNFNNKFNFLKNSNEISPGYYLNLELNSENKKSLENNLKTQEKIPSQNYIINNFLNKKTLQNQTTENIPIINDHSKNYNINNTHNLYSNKNLNEFLNKESKIFEIKRPEKLQDLNDLILNPDNYQTDSDNSFEKEKSLKTSKINSFQNSFIKEKIKFTKKTKSKFPYLNQCTCNYGFNDRFNNCDNPLDEEESLILTRKKPDDNIFLNKSVKEIFHYNLNLLKNKQFKNLHHKEINKINILSCPDSEILNNLKLNKLQDEQEKYFEEKIITKINSENPEKKNSNNLAVENNEKPKKKIFENSYINNVNKLAKYSNNNLIIEETPFNNFNNLHNSFTPYKSLVPSKKKIFLSKEKSETTSNGLRFKYKMFKADDKKFCLDLLKSYNINIVAKLCNVPLKSLKRWISVGPDRKKGGGRKVKDPDMEMKIVNWIKYEQNNGNIVNSKQIKDKALKYSTNNTFLASKGWLEKLKKKYRLNISKKIKKDKEIKTEKNHEVIEI